MAKWRQGLGPDLLAHSARSQRDVEPLPLRCSVAPVDETRGTRHIPSACDRRSHAGGRLRLSTALGAVTSASVPSWDRAREVAGNGREVVPHIVWPPHTEQQKGGECEPHRGHAPSAYRGRPDLRFSRVLKVHLAK